jgi:FixJ family two-component response regulator
MDPKTNSLDIPLVSIVALQAGAVQFLQKPVNKDALLLARRGPS